MQQEQHLERIKEHWKSSGSKRKDRGQMDDEEGGQGERRRRKSGSGKKRKRDKKAETQIDDQEEYEEDNNNANNYYEQEKQVNDQVDDGNDPQDLLAAAGLEDSDADENPGGPSSNSRRIRGWSETDDDEPKRQRSSTPVRENSVEMQQSDGE